MKHYLYKATLIFIFFLISCNDDESNPVISNLANEITNQEVVRIIEENALTFPNNTQISIAIIDNENTEYIGVINNNGVFQVTDNKNKIFEIGSITKIFTSILLSDLIQKEQAELNETLQDQFDFTVQNGGEIELIQLANHTSGLPRLPSDYETVPNFDLNDPFASYTSELLENYLDNVVVLNNPIGTQYEYSNLGMGLLGYILSKKTGKTYENLLKETIFEPLQMLNSTTLLSTIDQTQLVLGLDENGNVRSNWNFTNAAAGTGAIKSSVSDMGKFIHKNFENDIVYNFPQTATYTIGEGYEIGLAWNILNDEGFTIFLHNGGTGGYRSSLALDKNNKKAVIVLSNVSGFNVDSELIDQLTLSLLENISIN